MRFYLLACIDRRPPEVAAAYSHIKGRADGLEIAACSTEDLNGADVSELTFAAMQSALDAWIDAENETPEYDVDGNAVVQGRINLANWKE